MINKIDQPQRRKNKRETETSITNIWNERGSINTNPTDMKGITTDY